MARMLNKYEMKHFQIWIKRYGKCQSLEDVVSMSRKTTGICLILNRAHRQKLQAELKLLVSS